MLSSVEKIAFYLGVDAGAGRVDGNNNDTEQQRADRRIIMVWAQSISTSFQNYCNREFLIRERTQFFDVLGTQDFFVKAVPVVSITEIANDPLGLFQGDQWILQNDIYHLSQTGNSIQMVYNVMTGGWNAARIKYLGGLAYHATQSTFLITGVTGVDNITPGNFAYGSNSESMGKVVSITAVDGSDPAAYSLVLDNIYGSFQILDALTFQSSYNGQDIPATSANIVDITFQSLCEAFPELNRALEIELRYMQKHEADYENKSDGGKYGSERRTVDPSTGFYPFQPETMAILDQFKRTLMGS